MAKRTLYQTEVEDEKGIVIINLHSNGSIFQQFYRKKDNLKIALDGFVFVSESLEG